MNQLVSARSQVLSSGSSNSRASGMGMNVHAEPFEVSFRLPGAGFGHMQYSVIGAWRDLGRQQGGTQTYAESPPSKDPQGASGRWVWVSQASLESWAAGQDPALHSRELSEAKCFCQAPTSFEGLWHGVRWLWSLRPGGTPGGWWMG